VQEDADAKRIDAVAQAERSTVAADAAASRLRVVGHATAEAERARIDAYRDAPQSVMIGLAAQELAKKLHIEHLAITPELIGPALTRLADAGARRLER
jgi:hypothetical protein